MEQLYWAVPLLVIALGLWKFHRYRQARRNRMKVIEAARLVARKPPKYGKKRRVRHNSKKTRGNAHSTSNHKYMANDAGTQHRLKNVKREETEINTSRNHWWT